MLKTTLPWPFGVLLPRRREERMCALPWGSPFFWVAAAFACSWAPNPLLQGAVDTEQPQGDTVT